MVRRRLSILLAASTLAGIGASAAFADEGMWQFDAFPFAKFKAEYGWAPTQPWLDKVRQSSVRLSSGCSASFVSGEGLILTNHHCVVGCLDDLSSADEPLVETGLIAASRSDERVCPGLQAEVVVAMTDVTSTIKLAIGDKQGADAVQARTGAIANLEKKACPDTDKTRCQVVTLYGGGQYKLYSYRKYSDVRLAWAPEVAAQAFGGDPDNYNYPRFSLDGAFLRAYEDGQPVATPNHLTWTARTPEKGEVVFVVGNPGRTSRKLTLAEFAYQREVNLPIEMATSAELRGRLIRAMSENAQYAREGEATLYSLENNFKRTIGRTKALQDPAFNAMLVRNENELRQKVAGNAAIGDPWATVETAVAAARELDLRRRFATPSGRLVGYALTLVRAAEERAKPNGERSSAYTDSALPLTERRLLAERPVYPWMEQLTMEWSLSKAREYLGPDHPQTKLLLGRYSPEALSQGLVSTTRLADPAYRKMLWEGGAEAIAKSRDPMIVYARQIAANERALDKEYDEKVDGPITAARAKLTDARFAAYGDSVYPDATFSLRITFGRVGGWIEDGREIPHYTTWAGAFDRATGYKPFALAKGIEAAKERIDMTAPMNFVYATDTIGGNSGSPVLDKDANVIGANFDRNIHGLRNDYAYDMTKARSVGVTTAALEQAMRTIYPAPGLLKELNGE